MESLVPLWTSREELPALSGLREDRREVLLTRATDAEPQITWGMPAPSIWPLVVRARGDVAVHLVDLRSVGRGVGRDPARHRLTGWFWPKEDRSGPEVGERMMSRRIDIVGDVSHLQDYAFGPIALGWWGGLGFMLIEGMAFVLAIGAYFYLMPFEQRWPPAGPPPDLRYGTAFTVLMLLSLIPNHLAIRAAHGMICAAPGSCCSS